MCTTLELFPPFVARSSIEAPLLGLHQIYEEIDRAQERWIAQSPYRCPSGCGSCCERFEPDLLDVEALYLAAWMLRHQTQRLDTLDWSSNPSGCPLYDPHNPHHCTVYEGRPLVCRLFAFSGDRGKDGSIRYRPCKFMPPVPGAQTGSLDQGTLEALYGATPPAMGDLAGQAALLIPDRSDDRLPLREALQKALAKLRHLGDLSSSSAFGLAPSEDTGPDGGRDNGGGNDNDDAPLPRAS
jgi:Fe-S-cluster containining protein